ncbi:hypothetical protein GW943_01140 [Candidatus Parcubacteria bacterium]|uniref:Uncharacterized protein n=1 Tax=Candidatus Kaiserbacteria bacterium CG10_big_fil_rev_8_21_14_0_10_47_16 TaxID=1974608 RepID=A0A2H0UDG5_9BACT|nr:hypothetical protein [Candidatus Parcubacteria bacterium]PIR84431.1 MAG: hypothetical protein COU16_02520 [Candidatus Kaiserbacteria bacterium CG10_big_fil_rev_8_21_14_0_10_47_16]
MSEQDDHTLLRQLIERNNRVLEDNNKILKRLYHWSIFNGILRVLWYVVLIGLPFALYFYVLEPYFNAFGSSYDTFQVGLNEIPGVRAFQEFFGGEVGE